MFTLSDKGEGETMNLTEREKIIVIRDMLDIWISKDKEWFTTCLGDDVNTRDIRDLSDEYNRKLKDKK